MYVCVYVYIYIYIYIYYVWKLLLASLPPSFPAYAYMQIYVYVYIRTAIHVCMETAPGLSAAIVSCATAVCGRMCKSEGIRGKIRVSPKA